MIPNANRPAITRAAALSIGVAAAFLSCSPTGALAAAPPPHGAIQIENAVVVLPPNGARTAEGEFTIVNRGKADRMTAAASPIAGSVALHSMSMTAGGVMHMAPIAGGLPVPARGRVEVLPIKDRHMMFIGLKTPLHAGAEIPVTLRFQHAGALKAMFKVRPRT